MRAAVAQLVERLAVTVRRIPVCRRYEVVPGSSPGGGVILQVRVRKRHLIPVTGLISAIFNQIDILMYLTADTYPQIPYHLDYFRLALEERESIVSVRREDLEGRWPCESNSPLSLWDEERD